MNRIVLIDHNQADLTLLWHLIRKIKDHEAANFLNSDEAVTWCGENRAELIIIDSVCLENGQMKLLAQLRQFQENSNIPILMMTDRKHANIKRKAIEAGATDFLNKPIDTTEFITRVNNVLAFKNGQKKLADQTRWLKDEVHKATEAIRTREQEIIFRLTKAAEYRDPETGGHIKRMAHYSRLIAMQLGMSQEQQELLLEAAPMHDIGKVGIPDAILLKPGKLDYDEFEIMKEHAQYGYDILNDSPSKLMQIGAEIALSHHEKYDGSGYPNGLKDEAIPIYGRIVAVADVFDALTSERPYKKAWTVDDAIGLLRENSGKHFDRSCVYAFLLDLDEVLKIKERFKDNN